VVTATPLFQLFYSNTASLYLEDWKSLYIVYELHG